MSYSSYTPLALCGEGDEVKEVEMVQPPFCPRTAACLTCVTFVTRLIAEEEVYHRGDKRG